MQHTAQRVTRKLKVFPPITATSVMWTRPAIELLLSELRKRKTLYDQQHPDYINRAKRKACLDAIKKVLADKMSINASTEDIKNKIQVLRAQFNKDLRGMSKSKKYKPKFWCFRKMEWLKPYVNRVIQIQPIANDRTTTTNMDTSTTAKTNGTQEHTEISRNWMDHSSLNHNHNHNDMTSTSTFEADVPSSNILTSKLVDTVMDENNEGNDDMMDQFYDTITLTQQIVQNRMAAKAARSYRKSNSYNSWEGELVKSQLDLISDETIRSDTMWEIQCVLRRGIEQDRVLPKRRRKNHRLSVAASEMSACGSYISLDSNESIGLGGKENGDQNGDQELSL